LNRKVICTRVLDRLSMIEMRNLVVLDRVSMLEMRELLERF